MTYLGGDERSGRRQEEEGRQKETRGDWLNGILVTRHSFLPVSEFTCTRRFQGK